MNKYIDKIKKKVLFLVINLRRDKIKKSIIHRQEIITPKRYLNELVIDENHYSYSKTSRYPHLYSLVFSLLINNLLGIINNNSKLVQYLNSYQDEETGLFIDKSLDNENVNNDWWGWRHLSAIIPTAVVTLNGRTKYPFKFVSFLHGYGNTRRWLESLNWTNDSSNTSNAVMNYGVCLQYNRDFWGVQEANSSLEEMFEFLDAMQDKETGLWGGPHSYSQNSLSQKVQTAYHLWALYFYDKRKIRYIEKAIDSCLSLQNEFGGFGPGYKVGVLTNPFTNACEDIDCIDPLTRFYFLIDYRRKDIENCLRKAIPWVLYNQNKDGGFVFRRDEKFVYGHTFMSSKKNESNMFATWFRTLSLAYISKVLPEESVIKNIQFKFFDNCPGYQFWNL